MKGIRKVAVPVLLGLVFVSGSLPVVSARGQSTETPTLTHGVASGDVTANSAVIWARASEPASMYVAYAPHRNLRNATITAGSVAETANDYTAHAQLNGLNPNTRYFYFVWFSKAGSDALPSSFDPNAAGVFQTAPALAQGQPVSFVWGGDLGGQRYCRRVDQGYAIFSTMLVLRPDFFIANGDMIYADGDCPADGPDGPGGWQNIPGDFPNIANSAVDWTDMDLVRDIYRRHWQYNRNDPHFQAFLRATPMYVQWDDHEVINDFGAPWTYWNAANQDRPGYPNLVEAGREALFDYHPIARNAAEPNRIYRSFNWGKHLDLFILDARSYRTQNDVADTPDNDKTLLGSAQMQWIKQQLLDSQATWKVISNDVPISIPTGSNAAVFGRDAWANGTAADYSFETGFERELRDLLGFIDDHDIKNVVFVTTDVHFAQSIRYETDVNGDGDMLLFHEFVSGPLNAVRGSPRELDPTFNPTSLYAEGNLFNYGYARMERGPAGNMQFIFDIRDEDGQPRPGSTITLCPQ